MKTLRPDRDWQIILCAFAVVCIMLGVLGFIVFRSIKTDLPVDSKTEPSQSPREHLNAADIKNMINLYSEREKVLDAVRAKSVFPADPSL